jgi:succinate-semialdehyde dehydrogenase / glutarate-semialdehyde dehydrogenase
MPNSNTMRVRNPRTGQYDYAITPPTSTELEAVCDSLRKNQIGWSRLAINELITIMQAWKVAVEIHKSELIEALCHDTGRRWETLLEADIVASSINPYF